MLKKNRNYFILIIFSLWGIFFYKLILSNLFNDISDLTTKGTTYIIKLLEFSTYRYQELLAVFITFFILISLTNLIIFYYQRLDSKDSTLHKIIFFCYVVLNMLILYVTNIFAPIIFLLNVLSWVIIWTSWQVITMIWKESIKYYKNDLVFSKEFISKEEANEYVEHLKSNSDKNILSCLEFNIFEEEEYVLHVIANKQVILNKRSFIDEPFK